MHTIGSWIQTVGVVDLTRGPRIRYAVALAAIASVVTTVLFIIDTIDAFNEKELHGFDVSRSDEVRWWLHSCCSYAGIISGFALSSVMIYLVVGFPVTSLIKSRYPLQHG